MKEIVKATLVDMSMPDWTPDKEYQRIVIEQKWYEFDANGFDFICKFWLRYLYREYPNMESGYIADLYRIGYEICCINGKDWMNVPQDVKEFCYAAADFQNEALYRFTVLTLYYLYKKENYLFVNANVIDDFVKQWVAYEEINSAKNLAEYKSALE